MPFLLFVDLEKARKRMAADPGQLSLFGGSPSTPTATAGTKHVESVTVKAHERHTDHGTVQVPQHVRMVVKVDKPMPTPTPTPTATTVPAPPPGPAKEPPPAAPTTTATPTTPTATAEDSTRSDQWVTLPNALADELHMLEVDTWDGRSGGEGRANFVGAMEDRKDRRVYLTPAAQRYLLDEALPNCRDIWEDQDTPESKQLQRLAAELEARIQGHELPEPAPEPKPPGVDLSEAKRVDTNVSKRSEGDRFHMDRVFGRWMEPGELVAAIGMSSDEVKGARIGITRDGFQFLVTITSPTLYAVRRFLRTDDGVSVKGGLICENEHFELTETGTGRGAKIFARQVEALRKLGVQKISTMAGGSPSSEMFNGYWTWPRFGYDGPLPPAVLAKLKDATDLPATVRKATRISDLMSSAEGRDWWRYTGGESLHLSFDLAPDSLSSRVLAAYQAEKTKGAKKTSKPKKETRRGR